MIPPTNDPGDPADPALGGDVWCEGWEGCVEWLLPLLPLLYLLELLQLLELDVPAAAAFAAPLPSTTSRMAAAATRTAPTPCVHLYVVPRITIVCQY